MWYYHTELLDFKMEVDEALEDISGNHHNLQPHAEDTFTQNDSLLEQNNNSFDTNDLWNMNISDGESVQNVRNVEASTHGPDNYSELEVNQYLNLNDSPVDSCPSTQYVENGNNQSLDEVFQDFYKTVSSDMKTSSKAQEKSVATLHPSHMLTLDDQSKHFDSTGSDVGFNLDLTQFYIDAPDQESDLMMLQSPDVATSFASHLQPQYETFNEKKIFDGYSEPAMIQHSNEQEAAEFSQVNIVILENGQQFYLDFIADGDVASGSNEDNSITTYLKKEDVHSIEYINGTGDTETVTYVDQASTDLKEEGEGSLECINDNGEIETVMYVDQASNFGNQQDVQSLQYINDNGETETVMYVDEASTDRNQEGFQSLQYINDKGQTETVMYVDQATIDRNQEGVQSLQYINDKGQTETVMYVDQATIDRNQEGVQSLQYINDKGQTETVMYVDQATIDRNQEGVQSLQYINDKGQTETVTYVDQASIDRNQEGVQSLQYINDKGQTETVTYVDQASIDRNQEGVQSLQYINDDGETETVTCVDQASTDRNQEGVQSFQYINDDGETETLMYVNQASNYRNQECAQSLQYINDEVEAETVTYVDQASTNLNQEGVQSFQYINDDGETETLMYVNQASNYRNQEGAQSLQYINDEGETETVIQASKVQDQNTNAVDVTQYEIIDCDSNQSANTNSTLKNYQIPSLPAVNVDLNEQLSSSHHKTHHSQGTRLTPDLFASLLKDKNKKFIIVAKPLKNPKIRPSETLRSKFDEIDENTPNIPFLKPPTTTIKGSRKQKLRLINQIDSPLPKSTERPGRPCQPNKINKKMLSTATSIQETLKLPSAATSNQETPKLPSTYIRDRKRPTKVRQNRPRKINWDSDSDVMEDCDAEENNKS